MRQRRLFVKMSQNVSVWLHKILKVATLTWTTHFALGLQFDWSKHDHVDGHHIEVI